MKLHYDRDWYPVKHRFKGKHINYNQLGHCFAQTDWKSEHVFKPENIDFLTTLFSSEDLDYDTKNYKITNNLEIYTDRAPVKNRDYCIRDYYQNVENMFDAHMTSVVEQYKGKYTVLSSGGIDSHMLAAWMYKNKLDFEIVGLTNSPRQGQKSEDIVKASINAWNKIVPSRIIQLDKDLLVKDYVTGEYLASVPKPPQNHLDGYDHRTNNLLLEKSDWILHGGGSNHTMLHRADQTLRVYNTLDTSWKLFVNTSTLRRVNYPSITNAKYNQLLNRCPVFTNPQFTDENLLTRDIRWPDYGCWISYSRYYENHDNKFLNLVNRNWSDLWESINWEKLDLKLLNELLDAKVWRNYLVKNVGTDIESTTTTINGDSNHYWPNAENKEICLKLFDDLRKRFVGNIFLIREVMACQWLLNRYNKINQIGLSLCHMESFLQNHESYH